MNVDDPKYDFEKLAEEAIQSGYDPAVLDELEDYRPERAANIFQWMTDPRFMGGMKPYPKQLWILLSFMEEWCPMRFCTDTRFFREMFDQPLDEIRSRVTFLEHGVCPSCGVTKPELVKEGFFHNYYDLVGCAGQRSGKTMMIGGILATYHLHRLLCIPTPSRFYNLKEGSTLHMTFVADTKGHAHDTLWKAFRETFDSAPWFQSYVKYLTDEGDRLGSSLVEVKKTFVVFANKSLSVTFAEANKRKLRGYTRVFTGTDEIGWMDDDKGGTKVVADPDETYTALQKSLRTVRAMAAKRRREGLLSVPDGLNASISSPSRVTDKIMRLVRQSRTIKRMWAFHKATWDIHPDITRESLQDEYDADPVGSQRDYGADPPFSTNPFINVGEEAILRVATNLPVIKYETVRFSNDLGTQYVYLKFISARADNNIPRVLAVDAGEVYNYFGIGLGHLDPAGNLIVDQVFQAAPDKKNNVTVHFSKTIQEFILPLLSSVYVKEVVADRWQSSQMLQDIQDYKTHFSQKGTLTHRSSPDYEDALGLKNDLGFCRFPKPEVPFERVRVEFESILVDHPNLHLLYQLLSVRDNGRNVLKPIKGQDDLFQTVLNLYSWMKDPEHIKAYCSHSGYSRTVGGPNSRGLGSIVRKGSGVTRQNAQTAKVPVRVYSKNSRGGGHVGSQNVGVRHAR